MYGFIQYGDIFLVDDPPQELPITSIIDETDQTVLIVTLEDQSLWMHKTSKAV